MRQRRGAYAPEFRQQMVELVRVGRKPGELAKEFGCHETIISAWVRQAQADGRGGGRPDAPLTTSELQEFAQLRVGSKRFVRLSASNLSGLWRSHATCPISRARYVQENRKMRFQEASEGWSEGRLTQAEAAQILG